MDLSISLGTCNVTSATPQHSLAISRNDLPLLQLMKKHADTMIAQCAALFSIRETHIVIIMNLTMLSQGAHQGSWCAIPYRFPRSTFHASVASSCDQH